LLVLAGYSTNFLLFHRDLYQNHRASYFYMLPLERVVRMLDQRLRL
jgi:hypothetical protein